MRGSDKIKHHFGNGPVVWTAAWGISKLRKRAGRFAGAILGEARWYDEWYARVLSPETARKLSGMGVNLVVLPFSNGGSAEAELEEQQDFERMTAYLHAEGIVSLPYIQYQNILQEYHRLSDNVWAEGLDGSRTQFAYWRRTVCQNGSDFVAYLKALIAAALRRGADGVWIDNSYKTPCRCRLCMSGFKAYLARHYRHLLKELRLPGFENIELPPSASLSGTHDPIAQAYLYYGCEANLAIHRTLKAHLEGLSPTALYATNPGLFRGLPYGERGLDLQAFVQLHDLVYLENKLFPGVESGTAIGNYHGFIVCRTLGAIGIPGAWKPRVDFDSTAHGSRQGLPDCGAEVEAVVYEAAAFGGSPGLFWAVRSRTHDDAAHPAELRQMQMNRPELYTAARRALDFLRALPGGEEGNAADIAVLYHRSSHDLNHAQTAASIHNAEELLHAARIPYNVVFSANGASLHPFTVVVCPDIKLLSDEDAESLRAYVAQGGRLLVVGPLGSHDERNRIREEMALREVTGISAFGEPAVWSSRTYHQGAVTTLMMPGSSDEPIPNLFPAAKLKIPRWRQEQARWVAALDALLPQGRQVRVRGDGALGVALARTATGRTRVRIVRYEHEREASPLEVALRCDLAAAARGTWHSPDLENAAVIHAREEDGYRVFALEGFRVYGLLEA